MTEPPADPVVRTERELLNRLRSRLDAQRSQGNGRRWVVAEHVRCASGFDAARTLDAVAMDTWQSSGLPLHGFEIKVSRSDWRRELAQPNKAGVWRDLIDAMWLVTCPGVVMSGELPEGWGLLVTHGSRLRQVTAAVPWRPLPRNAERPPVSRDLVATMLRALVRQHASGAC